MHSYKKIIIAIFLLVSYLMADGQGSSGISIGQPCPDVEMKHMVNYASGAARISDFRGKLLILDFWATWCSPCVASFPKMDSLQKKFDGKIQILPVTEETDTVVIDFFEKMKKIKKIMPVSVTGDKKLHRLFKHSFIPHYVWIDPAGIVIAITDREELTAENIETVLSGQKVSLRVKKDIFRNIDERSRLFKIGIPVHNDGAVMIDSVRQDDVLFHSVITRYMEGVPGGSLNRPTGITIKNGSILSIYQRVVGGFNYRFLPTNRTRVEVKDSSMIKINTRTSSVYVEWLRQHGYCYELELPLSLASRKFEIALQDINRYFGALYNIESKMEKRKVKCLVLVRTSSFDKLATKGEKPERKENAFYFGIKNMPLREMMISLVMIYQQHSPFPLLDETGYTANTDLEINAKLSDMSALNKELEKYDLQFIVAEREIDMIVIKDRQ